MSRRTEGKKLMPRLRFPEFRDAGPWEVRTIEDMAERIAQGGTPKTSVAEYWNGEIPWITPAEMGDDAAHHYTERTLRTISVEGLQNSSAELLPVNSVIVSSRAPIGYVTINKVEMATNQGCKGIVPKAEVYHEFLYFSLLVANQRLNDLGAGAGFKEISASTLKVFPIPVPEPPEQQKIADCLSSLDEVIELEAKKLEALKAHKKGLMQQLFPREGETSPRLRFTEFRDAGPWAVKRLGEVFKITKGEQKSRISLDDSGLYPVINGGKEPSGYLAEWNSDKDTITISEGGESCGYVNFIRTRFWCGGHCYKLSIDDYSIDKLFAYHLLKSREDSLMRLRVGSGLPNIQRKDLELFYICAPSTKKEQQKIADCLSSLDEVIELEAKKLEALKAHKKGLMQQLFPQEEV